MDAVEEEMTNVLEHFGDDWQRQKNQTKETIDQLEIAFAIAFVDFEHYIQEDISG